MMAVFQVLLTEELLESAHRRNCFSYETAFRNLRNHNLTKALSSGFPAIFPTGKHKRSLQTLLTYPFISVNSLPHPVYSMTDGVVENIGWLRLGGYRIGIRSPSGAYFYYAHLAEYAKDFQIGETVSAGTFLGFMGDTGYSDVEGTTGNFAVHLHMGIYLNDKDGTEFSVNSYPMLSYLWERQGGALR